MEDQSNMSDFIEDPNYLVHMMIRKVRSIVAIAAESSKSSLITENRYKNIVQIKLNSITSEIKQPEIKLCTAMIKRWGMELRLLPDSNSKDVLVRNKTKSKVKKAGPEATSELKLVHVGNIPDIICDVHFQLNHAGYHQTFDYIKERYHGIGRDLVNKSIEACHICSTRFTSKTKRQSKHPVQVQTPDKGSLAPNESTFSGRDWPTTDSFLGGMAEDIPVGDARLNTLKDNCTDDGRAEEITAGEARLNASMNVEDTCTDDGEGPEESELHREATKQQTPEGTVTDSRDVPQSAGFQNSQKDMSQQSEPESRSQCVKESMTDLMKPWDQLTAGPSHHRARLGTNHFPTQTTGLEEADIKVSLDSQRMKVSLDSQRMYNGLGDTSRPPPPPSPPPPHSVDQAGAENWMKLLKSPKDITGDTHVEDCSTGAGGVMIVDLKMGQEKEGDIFPDSQPLQIDNVYKTGGEEKGNLDGIHDVYETGGEEKGEGGECRGTEARFDRGESVDLKIMTEIRNFKALSMHCQTESVEPVSFVGGKGNRLGKRKAGEGVEKREGIGKVMASTAITKAQKPRKAVHGKKRAKLDIVPAPDAMVPSVSEQLPPPSLENHLQLLLFGNQGINLEVAEADVLKFVKYLENVKLEELDVDLSSLEEGHEEYIPPQGVQAWPMQASPPADNNTAMLSMSGFAGQHS